ncbi:EAL domain-containing protein [Geomonas nitrogeniifigens]|uniref:EAL domain-containing protein n=1 Tax=Geomonas diazotrophica TaxID=2843197 RepID=A0ABX8JL98_9BACT|nr:GGDEF and EAL domain-containing protein [Geomonas nitrogeniifigens]QWV98429.1 EAL domain-containing protein [Geomonas nitrogeniifigens]QXE87611.1 EAL domain-containing protein [Geomonas nitrogeniifigens]
MHDAAIDPPRSLQPGSCSLQSLDQLQQDEERLAMLKETIDFLPIGAGITISDKEGKIVYVNQAEAAMHGYACIELIGRPARMLAPEAKAGGKRINHRTAGLWKRECLNVCKDGKIFPVQLTSLPIRNAGGDYLGLLTACEDMTQRKLCEQQLETLAYYDSVTKLPNRALLMDRLHQALALAQRERRELALLFLDLDNFKDLNSSKGHEVGDKFLQEVAARLAGCLCDSNTLARLGGDEFVIVINPVPGEEGVAATAARLQALFAEPFIIDGEELYGSTSIGIALYPEDGRDVESLLRCADAALYQAKSEGKAGYQFFSQEMNQVTMRRVALETGMRQGLARGEFYLYFQPQWDLKTLRLTGAEALLRWHSAEFGMVGPDEFIPIAESCGFIFDLGDLVLREACLHAVAWDGVCPGLKVAVNISGRQFRQPDFLQTVASVIEETGVRPSSLELEFTESVIMERAEKNIDALQALKKMGVRLSIDDFGTGYSSLNYLKHFPIDAIKIDRSFIADLVTDSDDAAIAEAIISMAHSLKLKVIAEGVESDDQLDFLADRRCDEAQGFYFAPPMPGEDFTSYVKRFSGLEDDSKPLSVAG